MDVQPDPDFATNRLVYITYSKPYTDLEGARTVLIRGTFQNDALTNIDELFSAQAVGRGHYGSRIAFDGNGYVFITAGDRQAPSRGDLYAHPSQDLSNHHGVVVRLHEDGRIPADNPFVGTAGALGEIWSYGHRNPQGLAFHPVTGDLWANEHGPQGGDELNVILPGRNYGWPVIGYGVNYGSGTTIHEGTRKEGRESPKHFWVPSIATSDSARISSASTRRGSSRRVETPGCSAGSKGGSVAAPPTESKPSAGVKASCCRRSIPGAARMKSSGIAGEIVRTSCLLRMLNAIGVLESRPAGGKIVRLAGRQRGNEENGAPQARQGKKMKKLLRLRHGSDTPWRFLVGVERGLHEPT